MLQAWQSAYYRASDSVLKNERNTMETKITRRKFLIEALGATALFVMPGVIFGKEKGEEKREVFS